MIQAAIRAAFWQSYAGTVANALSGALFAGSASGAISNMTQLGIRWISGNRSLNSDTALTPR